MAEKHNFLSLNIACNYSQVAIKALFMIRLSVFLTSAVANSTVHYLKCLASVT